VKFIVYQSVNSRRSRRQQRSPSDRTFRRFKAGEWWAAAKMITEPAT